MKSSSPEESKPSEQSFWKQDHPVVLPTLGLLVLPVIKMVGFLPIPDDLCSEIYIPRAAVEVREGLALTDFTDDKRKF